MDNSRSWRRAVRWVEKHRRVLASVGAASLAVVLWLVPAPRVPGLDAAAEQYFRGAMVKAGLAYAVCRGINAAVSVASHSTVEATPAGIGVSFAVGQVLDPLDDMTERLADVLVMAIASLGIQKLLYEMAVALGPPLLAGVLGVLAVLAWVRHPAVARWQGLAWRAVLLIVVGRFFLPVSAVVNTHVHERFFAGPIAEARAVLTQHTEGVEALQEVPPGAGSGLVHALKEGIGRLAERISAYQEAAAKLVENAGAMVGALLDLTFLYVGVFLVEVLGLPLATLWLMWKLSGGLVPAPGARVQAAASGMARREGNG